MKILLIGFEDIEVEGIKIILSDLGKILSVPHDVVNWTVEEIIEKSPEGPCDWISRKFVIIHRGDEYIKEVIQRVKLLDLGKIIFATTTSTSMKWPLSKLLDELISEDMYFRNLSMTNLKFNVRRDFEEK